MIQSTNFTSTYKIFRTNENGSIHSNVWLSRTISVVKEKSSGAAENVASFVEGFFTRVSELHLASYDLVCAMRKFEKHCLSAIVYLSKTHVDFTFFARLLRNHIAVVDFFQLAKDADYFVNGRYKEVRDDKGNIRNAKDTWAAITANAMSFAADTLGTVVWFQELGFCNLSKAADAVGKVRVFGFVKNISLTFVTLRVLDLMYVFNAVDSVLKFNMAENHYQKVCAGLYFSSSMSELVLSSLLMAGVTNLVGLGVVAATAIGFGVSAFCYRSAHENEVKPLYGT